MINNSLFLKMTFKSLFLKNSKLIAYNWVYLCSTRFVNKLFSQVLQHRLTYFRWIRRNWVDFFTEKFLPSHWLLQLDSFQTQRVKRHRRVVTLVFYFVNCFWIRQIFSWSRLVFTRQQMCVWNVPFSSSNNASCRMNQILPIINLIQANSQFLFLVYIINLKTVAISEAKI